MFTITRLLARQLRSVFRRAGIKSGAAAVVPVVFQAEPDGLRIRAKAAEAAVEYRLEGEFEPAEFSVPLTMLAACEGRRDDPVQFDAAAKGQVVVSWHDHGVPQQQMFTYGRSNRIATFPESPANFVANEPCLLAALQDAADTADGESTRYAIDCIQLSGQKGRIAATDGRHLLLQSGFQFPFPWQQDRLIPRTRVFGSVELRSSEVVAVGSTDEWICIRVGPWSIYLAIRKNGRFPRVDDLIPQPEIVTARFQLSESDAQFLVPAIDHLPGGQENNAPVTLDLNGQVVVRAKAADQPQPTELVLSSSQRSGDPLQLVTNRKFLRRAVQLGFREVQIVSPERAVLCDDGQRQYLWMPLDAQSAVPPSADALRIDSHVAAIQSQSISRRRRFTMPPEQTTANAPASDPVQGNGHAPHNGHGKGRSKGAGTSIEQAVILRDALRDATSKANELIRSLKRNRRQSRIVESTLASLKQLQGVA